MEFVKEIIPRLPYFALAGLLSWLTYLMYKKSWQKPFTITLILAFVSFFCAFGWFQGFFKSGVVSLLIKGMEDLGNTLNKYSQTTESVRTNLMDVAKTIENQQISVGTAQSNIFKTFQQVEQQHHNTENIQDKLRQVADNLERNQKEAEQARKQLETYQKKLEDIRGLTKLLYEQRTVETFDNTSGRKFYLGKKADGSFGVLIALSRIPIPQTVDIQTDEFNVIPTAVYPHKNVLLYKVTGTLKNLKRQRWFVSYIPDPTRQDEGRETIAIDANTNFMAGGLVFREYFAIPEKE